MKPVRPHSDVYIHCADVSHVMYHRKYALQLETRGRSNRNADSSFCGAVYGKNWPITFSLIICGDRSYVRKCNGRSNSKLITSLPISLTPSLSVEILFPFIKLVSNYYFATRRRHLDWMIMRNWGHVDRT